MVIELIQCMGHDRSRKIEACIRPVIFNSLYISIEILPAIYSS